VECDSIGPDDYERDDMHGLAQTERPCSCHVQWSDLWEIHEWIFAVALLVVRRQRDTQMRNMYYEINEEQVLAQVMENREAGYLLVPWIGIELM
jgi:hypothetical protein